MRPLAYLVTALLAASLAYGWWMSNHLTTMEAAVFGIGAAVNMLMYALSALEVK